MKKLGLFVERVQAVLKNLNNEQSGMLFRRLISYAEGVDNPCSDVIVEAMFSVLKLDVDQDKERYEAVVQRNRHNGSKGGRPRKNQENPKNPNGFLKTQENPKNPITSTSTSTSNIKETINSFSSTSVDATAKVDVDFVELVNYWNEKMNGKVISKLQKLTQKRKAAVLAREKEYGKEAIKVAIDKTAESTFLNGGGSTGFIASFDWVFTHPNNFVKVIEGNYDNKAGIGTANAIPKKHNSASERVDAVLGLLNND